MGEDCCFLLEDSSERALVVFLDREVLWHSGGDKSFSCGSVLDITGYPVPLVLATNANINVPDTVTTKSTTPFPNTWFSDRGSPSVREPCRVLARPLTLGELTVPLTWETKYWVKSSVQLSYSMVLLPQHPFGLAKQPAWALK